MPATTTRTRWFGNILDWQYNRHEGMHCAWYQGHTYYLTKVDRHTADDLNLSRGWHLWFPEELDGWSGYGPGVGQQIDEARRVAEVRITCPYSDMHVSAEGAGLPIAISGDGAYAWDNLVLYPDHERGQFTLAPEPHGEPVAMIRPVFLGVGSTVTVRWRAFTPTDDLLAFGGSWRDMLRDLRQQLGG